MMSDIHISTEDGENTRSRIDNLLKNMDKNGIDMAVVFPFAAGLKKQKKFVGIIKPNLGRFIPLAFINPKDCDAKEQLIYCLDELKFKGMKLHPWFGDFRLDDIELLRPVMEVLDERGLYAVIHCTSDDDWMHPLMFERLGMAFPNVTIQMAHMGEVMAREDFGDDGSMKKIMGENFSRVCNRKAK